MGFYINELNCFPESIVNFVFKTIGVKRLIKLVEKYWSCYFKYALTYLDNKGVENIFTSVEERMLSKTVKTGNDKGWEPLMNVFISPYFLGRLYLS